MLTDLRKYITDDVIIPNDSVGFYIQQLMIHCKNTDYVNTLVKKISKNAAEIVDNEINPFSYLIQDYHFQDCTETENTVINLLLSNFDCQYIIENTSFNIESMYYNHTHRGRMAQGLADDVLTKFIENEWIEFLQEFNINDEEFENIFENGDDDDMFNEYEFTSMIIVLDETNEDYFAVLEIMESMGFLEVVPGLLFYGSFGPDGCDDTDIDLSEDQLDVIMATIESLPKFNVVEDKIAQIFNVGVSCVDDYLYLIMKNKSSRNEVLF